MSDYLTVAGISSGSIVVLGILYKVYNAINHKEFKSSCCGNSVVASIDINDTAITPKVDENKIIYVNQGRSSSLESQAKNYIAQESKHSTHDNNV